MNAGHDSGLPDYSGGQGPYGGQGPSGGQDGRPEDPYAAGPTSIDPYARNPYASDPYPSEPSGRYSSDPFSSAPAAGDPLLGAGSAPGGPPAHHPSVPAPQGPPRFGAFPAPVPSSSAAITGFVLGVLGVTMCGGLTSPFGIFFSSRGLQETAPTARELKGGRGLAVAGMVTSLVGLIPLLFILLYVGLIIVGLIMSAVAG